MSVSQASYPKYSKNTAGQAVKLQTSLLIKDQFDQGLHSICFHT